MINRSSIAHQLFILDRLIERQLSMEICIIVCHAEFTHAFGGVKRNNLCHTIMKSGFIWRLLYTLCKISISKLNAMWGGMGKLTSLFEWMETLAQIVSQISVVQKCCLMIGSYLHWVKCFNLWAFGLVGTRLRQPHVSGIINYRFQRMPWLRCGYNIYEYHTSINCHNYTLVQLYPWYIFLFW